MTQEAHTPEPWEVIERNGYFEILADRPKSDWYGRKGKHAVAYADTDCENAEDNARRIVACVNALAGIPIEAIESGVVAELAQAAQRIIDGGYVSKHIEEERADYEALINALAKLEASK